MRQCVVCKTAFDPPARARKTIICSEACRKIRRKEYSVRYYEENKEAIGGTTKRWYRCKKAAKRSMGAYYAHCAFCGGHFDRETRPNAKYCSPLCSNQAALRKAREARPASIFVCVVCDQPITSKNRRVVCNSVDCRNAHKAIQKRRYRAENPGADRRRRERENNVRVENRIKAAQLDRILAMSPEEMINFAIQRSGE